MSKATAARRLVTAAAVGGGGLGLVGGSLYGVLNVQAKLARRRIGNAKVQPPDPGGLYGGDRPGEPLRLAVLGDSAAAGYGATVAAETFGAFLATGLVDLALRPVQLHSVARVGARTAALEGQIAQALKHSPEVCAIIIGANDVTHKVRPSESVRLLKVAVASLRAAGTEVVVGTCPDLGAVQSVAYPLRQVARSWSRRLAAAQSIAVVEAGGRAVSLASLLSPEFISSPRHLFGPDQFHPSPAGYRSCAAAMLPTVASAAGVELGDADSYEPWRGEGVFSLAWAAAVAANSAGTEVSRVDQDSTAGAGVGGDRDAGRAPGQGLPQASQSRWALLRHRRSVAIPDASSIETELEENSPQG
ncbi:MAG: SGNH/GDSL hydrolase family protein [Nocardioidaceae bacterium]